MNRFVLLLLVTLSMSACQLLRQATLARDSQSETYLAQGKSALRAGRYTEALDAFEMARQRDFNQSTTAAIYLSGLAAYYLNYNEIAEIRFTTIIEDFPDSRYKEDAQYHLAMVLTRSRHLPARLKGMNDLLKLGDNAEDRNLGKLAFSAFQEYLFYSGKEEDLETFYSKTAPERYKKLVLEAMVYRKVQNGVPQVGKSLYEDYLNDGGDSSRFLNAYFPPAQLKEGTNWFEPNIMRVAVFLPLFLDQPSIPYMSEMPERSKRAVEFYEGMRMAIESFEGKSQKKIYLKVYDTRRDTQLVKMQLGELEKLRPHMIIGEIYNQETLQISAWAESHQTMQVIPFSASSSLVKDKAFTFLAHPSAETHGARLAEYAFDELQLRRISVFTDNGIGARQLMEGFGNTFIGLGGAIDTLAFDADYEEFGKEQIPRLVDKVRGDGIYVPVTGNEEAASLIVNLLKREGKDNLPLMGSPHFYSRYNTLGRETKESFQMIFTSSFLPNFESVAFQEFVVEYRNRFRLPPSEEAVQGYDLGRFLVEKIDQYNTELPIPLNTYFKIAPEYKALHVDFHFDKSQSNQRVNIGQFVVDGIMKLNP